VSLANPQSWNRYAYVLNNPLALITCSAIAGPVHGEVGCPVSIDGGYGGGDGGDGGGGGGIAGGGDSNCPPGEDGCDANGNQTGDPDGDNSGDDNSGDPGQTCDPTDPTCDAKQQMVLGLLNSACNGMYGGLANGIRDLAATQYTTVGSFTPTDANGQLALTNAQGAFANGSPDPAYTQYFNNDNPQNPPSSTTYLAITFLQPSFYQFSPVDQMGILFHELKHAAGYGGEIDPAANATPEQINAWDANELQTNEQNCSPQQVPTQDSQVDGTIQ